MSFQYGDLCVLIRAIALPLSLQEPEAVYKSI